MEYRAVIICCFLIVIFTSTTHARLPMFGEYFRTYYLRSELTEHETKILGQYSLCISVKIKPAAHLAIFVAYTADFYHRDENQIAKLVATCNPVKRLKIDRKRRTQVTAIKIGNYKRSYKVCGGLRSASKISADKNNLYMRKKRHVLQALASLLFRNG